ncbi:helix-turn-helix domain-containing protein [Ruminococcus sp.]|uniref:helix-turn-helix domain-containing protein n=1 Tax=Ruminococcus sp. TaxID=41978 RepID=UPI00262E828C|nr:helix-turn-helix transcriptional regulator [Ruminococcus sp.]MDD6988572.1 helix-turn-helix transcriptional regulator [Ruminococcus sp.]MDY6201377.1 helix-turn-helix transcriptional regulator [Ruminococcus sp.]
MVKNLKLLRTNKGLSQQQLAEVIGTSQQSINKYENHKVEPDIDTLIAFADFFNTSVDYLIGNTDINRKIEPVHQYYLNDEEISLIDGFRKLTKGEKDSIFAVVNNYNTAHIR